jgi:hypothetical protein
MTGRAVQLGPSASRLGWYGKGQPDTSGATERAFEAALQPRQGEISAPSPHECLQVQFSPVDAFPHPLHAVAWPPRAPHGDAPSRGHARCHRLPRADADRRVRSKVPEAAVKCPECSESDLSRRESELTRCANRRRRALGLK